ncbi:hypothetical protein [Nesterenkonia marinintestina]|uniref:hypothetical protein n=1 Tax=Nesterenkonia marinintestina TaxID=2979865 RepID=UPI0021BEE545|nr:hypothetical protein [Nesterenkonia sp. GX14115]
MTALLVLAVAVCDLVPLLRAPRRADDGRRLRRIVYAAWFLVLALVLPVLGAAAIGPPGGTAGWWAGPAAAAAGLLWVVLRGRGSAAPLVMGALVVAGALVEVAVWGSVAAHVPPVLLWAGVILFLTESSNRITRAMLDLTGRGASDDDGLRGGRLIGPLERILMTVLALFGAQAVVAALAAAKGIVRFPAISGDRPGGTRAEEFLIGSLTSWGLAGAGALLLWSAQIT